MRREIPDMRFLADMRRFPPVRHSRFKRNRVIVLSTAAQDKLLFFGQPRLPREPKAQDAASFVGVPQNAAARDFTAESQMTLIASAAGAFPLKSVVNYEAQEDWGNKRCGRGLLSCRRHRFFREQA